MEQAVKTMLDRMSKAQLNEGLDALCLSYLLENDSSEEEIKLVHATLYTLKSFLKSI